MRLVMWSVALLLTACDPVGTYVHIHMEGPNIAASRIELDLVLGGRTTRTAYDAAVVFPTDAVLDVQSGEGALAVTAVARDASGAPRAHALGSARVVRGETSEVTLSFLPTEPDGVPTDPSTPPLPPGSVAVLSVDYRSVGAPLGLVDLGHGRVTSTPAGIDCGSDHDGNQFTSCTLAVEAGTQVTLEFKGLWGHLSALAGACSDIDAPCVVDLSTHRVVQAKFSLANYMFVTKNIYTPGEIKAKSVLPAGATETERFVDGADQICAESRLSETSPTFRNSTYRAWISTSGLSAKQRIAATGARGWALHYRGFADSLDDLLDPNSPHVYAPPEETEDTTEVSTEASVWTGTNGFGATGDNCNDWTSTSASDFVQLGMRHGSSMLWSASARIDCATAQTRKHRIYCFGVDRHAKIRPNPPPVGPRRVFVSAGEFIPSSGIASADALCQGEAQASQLPGTYKALLATTTQSAAQRFTLEGQYLVRPDGPKVTPNSPADLFVPATQTVSTINIDATGRAWPNLSAPSVFAWVGAENLSQPGSAAQSCSDWSSASGDGIVGLVGIVNAAQFNTGSSPCSVGRRVYCLQE